MQLMKTLLDMRITQKRILQAAILIKIDCYLLGWNPPAV
jgi:hypothetical protein